MNFTTQIRNIGNSVKHNSKMVYTVQSLVNLRLAIRVIAGTEPDLNFTLPSHYIVISFDNMIQK